MAVGVLADDAVVLGVCYLPPETPERAPHGGLARRVEQWLRRYEQDPHAEFDLPLASRGTAFQRRVWAALRTIPVGQALTYGQLAQSLGSVARAVGQACGDNPWPLAVPCHRIMGARGLGGFSHQREGSLVEVKRRLLVHEGVLTMDL